MMAADKNIYRITYDDGSVKLGTRKVLGPVVGQAKKGHAWYRKPLKIERVPEPEWQDVTADFL